VQNQIIEFTQDNPETLIGNTACNYRVSGFKLGITRAQAWDALENHPTLMGFKDDYNPSRIYVYCKNADGTKGEAALYLIWEVGVAKMGRMTVFEGYRPFLSNNMRRLLTFEAVDRSSVFMKQFIGRANRVSETILVASSDYIKESKLQSYCYDDIGLEVTHKIGPSIEGVSFAIMKGESC